MNFHFSPLTALRQIEVGSSSLCGIGLIRAVDGKYAEAVRCYKRALQIYSDAGDKRGEAMVLMNLGTAYGEMGMTKDAIKTLEGSVKIYRGLGDVPSEGKALTNLANVYAEQGLPDAIPLYEQSATCKQAAGDILGVASVCLNLARFYVQLKSRDLGLQYAEQALKIYEEAGDPAANRARELIARIRSLRI